jgi:hypothetical protein
LLRIPSFDCGAESVTTAMGSLGGAYCGPRISSAVLQRCYQAFLVSFWAFNLSITISKKCCHAGSISASYINNPQSSVDKPTIE